jgi:glucans biosynthesis protein C
MAEAVRSPGPSAARPAAGAPETSRMAFIDNLRWLVIGMVVIMHACVTYSGLGSWYYKEPSALGAASMLVFSAYQSFAQAFFMGLLFLIGAYFIPRAYDRKGFGRFVRDRLFRLGVPTLVYMLVLNPLIALIMASFKGQALTAAAVGAQYARYVGSFQFLSGTGPLWFAFALLVFSILYAVVRLIADAPQGPARVEARTVQRPAVITHRKVIAVIFLIGVVAFLVRLVQPVGTSWLNMQFCFFTQYVVLFLIGLWAERTDLLRTLPEAFGTSWLRLAFAVGVPVWLLLGGLGGALTGSMDAFGGGLHWQAAGYALWESFFCVAFSLGLITLFRERVNAPSAVAGFLSANAFGVYVFHAPILVAISMTLHRVLAPALAKAALVSAIALAASFLFAALVRTVPGLRKVFG